MLIDSDERIYIFFVCEISRVALLKKLSLPRTQLLSLIGTLFCDYELYNIYSAKNYNDKFGSDWMLVMHWIQGNSKKLKTFLQNRVAEIHLKTNTSCWPYCLMRIQPIYLHEEKTLKNLQSIVLWWKCPR